MKKYPLISRIFGLAICASGFGACVGGTSNGGGAGGVLLCGTGGACPANMKCNENNVCVFDASAGDAAAAAGKDTASGTAADTATVAPDAAAGKDAAVAETTAGPDQTAGGKDEATAADVPAEPVPATVKELQSGAASLTCEKTDGTINYAKVVVEPCVVTGPPQLITASTGKKSTLFYMRPATGPLKGDYAGIAVIIGANPLPIAPGDVVQVTGTVQEFFCMTEIIADTVDAVVAKGKVAPPEPYTVPLATLADTPEPYESDLLRVSGVTVDNPNVPGSDGKFHGQFSVKSGGASIFVALGYGSQYYDKDGKTKFTAGSSLGSVAGHWTYSFGQFVLRLRDDLDLQQ